MITIYEGIPMVNQINNASNGKAVNADDRVKNKEAEGRQTNVQAPSSPQDDQVNISESSKQLEALKASLQDLPEINEARVAYFKKEIALGNYEINSGNIAKKMLNLEETV